MKIKIISILSLMFVCAFSKGQDLNKLTEPIVAEGKKLYNSETISWHGTDLFLAVYKQTENVGGYLSLHEDNIPKCVFFSRSDNPKVIGTISFDSTYNPEKASTDLTQRDFTSTERDLYTIRKKSIDIVNSDTSFKTYKNTNLNFIPLIDENGKRVYILTASTQNGVVIFGNDYLLNFDEANNLLSKKSLHKNLIPISYGGKEEEGKEITGTMHTHLPETGDFITATDICTLMLYSKFAKWQQHNVVSKNYLNIWNCQTNNLVVIPMGTIDKIDKDQSRRKRKKSQTP